MNIYFVRHGDAESKKPGQTDAERELTAVGVQQAQDLAKWMQKHGIQAAAVITSPLIRARQTAQPIADALGVPLQEDEHLGGGLLTMGALERIIKDAGDAESIMLVGHEPDLSGIIRELTGGEVEMKKAGAALVQCDGGRLAKCKLVWLIPPAFRG